MGVNNLVGYLNRVTPDRLASEIGSLEKDLVGWRDSLFLPSRLSLNTRRDYFLAARTYIKYLITTKRLEALSLPKFSEQPSKYRASIADSYNESNTGPVDNREDETSYKFRCFTNNQAELTTLQDLGSLRCLKRGEQIAQHFKNYQTSFSRSTQYRRLKVFKAFIEYLKTSGRISVLDSINSRSYRDATLNYYYERLEQNKDSLISFISDWNALKLILISYSRVGVFPEYQIPSPPIISSKISPLLKRNYKLLSMSLRNVVRTDEKEEVIPNAFDLAERPDEDFLVALERDEKYVFYEIQRAAKIEALIAIKGFKDGQAEIAKCDIQYLEKTFIQTRELVDLRFQEHGSGHNLSFFSKKHPNGLRNLLGYFWFKNNGLALSNAFPGARRISEFGAKEVRNMLGLNSHNALPFFLIILAETGLNVEALENAKIEDRNGKKLLLAPTVTGELVNVDIRKPRARRTLSKLIPSSRLSSILEHSEETEINAYVCFKAVLDMTEQYRKANSVTDLWIGPYFNRKPHSAIRISPSAFKSDFKRFLNRHESLRVLDQTHITRANIRVTGGIIAWFNSDGDPKATAAYLGNSPMIALKSYVPQQIVDILHRRRIRRHQNIVIIAAVDGAENLKYRALPELDKSRIDYLVSHLAESDFFKESDLGNALFPIGEKCQDDSNTAGQITFILSKENIAILKLIADSAVESELVYSSALSKTELFEGKPLCNWIELWRAVNYTLSTSNDRGHTIALAEGLNIAKHWVGEVD